ncbi:BTAD domain-containing putative transcriptional regulator [Streptomyces sp. H10-C2]|uniref:BTAD domain-containing putative transcriptional regulator n=1 Tax=unclassified Streptomyces TaxID=2593676 RepID=UPI0024B87AD9|nr:MULTISPECIES: BTAD domain-containing putative transcriptional regulator [unclassified Streptomyces]MDJ0340236.1 BTAD domain-containing putative transcriptional regulator [Streptomyces sp. PH10-H1]MDJ0368315.1 BTAD domain-containing putative transcriptional regulator [Streptomyces sp. H10-C2]
MFGILGATQVWNSDGSAVALGGPRRRALLALLLIDAGRVVTAERLIDGLYGENPPAGVANALQSQVSRLRQVLPRPIEFHPAGYRLAIDPDDVDSHRFQRLSAEGREALAAGDPARAAALLRDALSLWRGPALADVGDASFAQPQVTRLEELRVSAAEDRIEAELALGGHRELVAELRELVDAHPLRERLRGQLMRALYGSGRQSEALEAYEDARSELAETLGADPGPELAAVHLAVLRGDPGLTPAAHAHVPRGTSPTTHPPSTPSAPRFTLPAQLTSFVGRTEELDRIGAQLADGRLVTLIGPGGAGKTRLAVEAAGRYGGEACFVELAGLTDAAEVPHAIQSALGLREAGVMPGAGPAPDPVARVTAALADRPLLLVLDNCEHVVAEIAKIVGGLLGDCVRLRVLATTREPLGIPGETLCPIPPLRLPPPGTDHVHALEFPAVRLFAERAVAVRPDFVLAADLDAVLRVCTALDGLPLAIELAAARLRSMSASEIASRLGVLSAVPEQSEYGPGIRPDERFRLLSRGSRTAQPRQKTLRGVVDWSWDLLSEAERAALRRVSVFAGGWTLEAAEAVCADADGGTEHRGTEHCGTQDAGVDAFDVLDLIDSLVDKSLVVVHRPEGADGVRYRMLETIRAYGAERLAEAGETAALRRAHAGYFLGVARDAEPHLRRAEQLDWLRRLSTDQDNLHTALRRCVESGDTTTALRLLAPLSTYWLLRGVRLEGAGPARALLDILGPGVPEGLDEEYVLCVLAAANGVSDHQLGDHTTAAEGVMAGLSYIPQRFPSLAVIWAMAMGAPTSDAGELIALSLDQWVQDPWAMALLHLGQGYAHWMVLGDAARAEEEFTLGLAGFRVLGDRWAMANALDVLSQLADWQGDHERAAALTDEALGYVEPLGAIEDMAQLLCRRAERSARDGDAEAARADYERVVELSGRAGAPDCMALAHLGLGEAARMRGELAEARKLFDLALSESGTGWAVVDMNRPLILIALARVAEAEEDPEQARSYYRQVPEGELVSRNGPVAASFAEALAGLALLEGGPERAALLLGVARALRGAEVPPGQDTARVTAAARAALGDTAYAAAHARGVALSRDQTVDALTDLGGERSAAGT